jgi:hypothetical protein
MKFFPISLLFFFVLTATSCSKDDPIIPNEEEVITTLRYSLMPQGGGIPLVFSFQDLDGGGGNAAIVTGGNLMKNQIYNGTIDLLNEQGALPESITEEIRNEAEDHQFFFLSNVSSLSVSYDDSDANGNPLGIKSVLQTGDSGSGILTIVLRHLPDKMASGVSDGDITNAGGETDLSVTFDVNVF